MKSLWRVMLVLALLVPAGVLAASPADAGLGAAFCSGSSGTLTATPGLVLTAKKPQTYAMSSVPLTCTGGFVDAGTVTGSFRSSTEVRCGSVFGVKNAGTATFTWTAPGGMGKTTAKLNLKLTSTDATSTTGTFAGITTTTGSGLFKDDGISGSITLGKSLLPAAQGGSCTVTIPITSFPITAITLNIT
jgi:hypothetical protein